jgi:hypothetical protein
MVGSSDGAGFIDATHPEMSGGVRDGGFAAESYEVRKVHARASREIFMRRPWMGEGEERKRKERRGSGGPLREPRSTP